MAPRDNDTGQSGSPGGVKIRGVVAAAEVYHPHLVVTTWFRRWALKCGACGRDFHRFASFGLPRCPWCGVRNSPEFELKG